VGLASDYTKNFWFRSRFYKFAGVYQNKRKPRFQYVLKNSPVKIIFTKRIGSISTMLSGMILGVMFLLQSCNKDSGTDPIAPYNYYPLEIGQFQIYQVNEEVYSAGNANPVLRAWQERDEVTSVSQDSSGAKVFIVSRYTRNTASQAWQKTKEYSVRHDPDKVIVNLDNEILMPLVFPYSPQVTWDGYRYFKVEDTDPRYRTLHKYENINQPLTINNLNFDKTIKVAERTDTTALLQYRLGYKEYAANVGLIVDEQTNFEYLQEGGEIIGEKIIASGTRRVRKIIEHGISQ
jgi:hypothetical protein